MTLWRSPQNLPQNLGKYYINELIFELITAAAVAVVQIGQSCILPSHCSLPPERTDEVATKNETLANLTSFDHSWSHTRRIIIICRTWEFIKLFVIFTKSSVLFFSSIYPSGFQSLATSNSLLFRHESSLPLPLKKELQGGVGQCMVTFPEENFLSVFIPTL